jgi:ankyrin repeat protein
MFRKRSGTTDNGKSYEDKILAIIALKLVSKKEVKSFELSSNNSEFGDFDDVVVQTTLHNNKCQNVALQLKHKNNNKSILKSSLAAKSGPFSLQRYYQQYQKLNCHSNFTWVFYTNNILELNGPFTFQLEEKEHIEVTAKLGNCLWRHLLNTSKVDECVIEFEVSKEGSGDEEKLEASGYKHFFENFRLYVNQANVEKATSIISSVFAETYDGVSSFFFVNFITAWSLQEGCKDLLTDEIIKAKICEIAVTPYIKIPTSIKQDKKSLLLRQIINHFDITIAKTFHANLWQDVDRFDDAIRKTIKRFGIVVEDIDDVGRLEALDKVRILWHMKKLPFFIETTESNGELLEKVLELCQRQRKFVLIGENIDASEFSGLSVFQNLTDLNVDDNSCKALLKEFTVSLQGRKQIPLEEILQIDDKIKQALTPSHLENMLYDNFCIGEDKTKRTKYYLSRNLSRVLITFNYIKETFDDMCLINCCGKLNKIRNKLVGVNLIELDMYLKDKNSPHGNNKQQKKFICYHNDMCTKKEFTEFCEKTPKQICHLFRITKNNKLEWMTSNGSINTLRKHRFTAEYFHESEASSLSENKFNIICGEAGSGKSALMRHLKKYFLLDVWVISLNLRQHFSQMKKEYKSCEEVLDHICRLESEQHNYRSFDEEIRNIFQQKKKFVVLWDGLDEVPKAHLDTVLNTFGMLLKADVVQWVTSRPNLQTMLENEFDVFAFTIKELTRVQQNNYIKDRLGIKDSEKLEKLSQQIFDKIAPQIAKQFLGVPMQLEMLTDLLIEDPTKYHDLLQNIFSLTDLYDTFIDKQFQRKFEDTTYDSSKSTERYIYEHFKSYHQQQYEIVALKVCLNEEIFKKFFHEVILEPFLQQVRNDGDIIGIVAQDKNGSPMFYHNTFGEYFVASWLSKNCKHVTNLMSFFFDEQNKNIRLMFDMIVAKDCYAHLAVLYENIESLKTYSTEISVKDKCGRSPLHLICSRGERHNLSDVQETGGKYIIDFNKLSKVKIENKKYDEIMTFLMTEGMCHPLDKDMLYSWTCIHYANATLSLRSLDNILAKFPDFCQLNDLKNFQDKCSVLVYSVIYNYSNLFQIINPISYFEDKESRTNLLHLCALYNRPQFLQKLLDKSNRNYRKKINHRRDQPSHISFYFPKLNIASQSIPSRTLTIKSIVTDDWTPLEVAIDQGHMEIVMILLSKNADFIMPNKYGVTCSHKAAAGGRDEILNILCQKGADINVKDQEGRTPLHYSTLHNHLSTTQLLINKNAKLYLKDVNNRTPLDYAASRGYVEMFKLIVDRSENFLDVNKSLLYAADGDENMIVKYLVIEREVDVNFQYNGKTSLHCASRNGHFDVVKFLVKRGAEVNKQEDKTLLTALHYAGSRGFLKIIKFLIDNGANSNLRDKQGKTCLHYSVIFGNVEVVKYLTEKVEDVNAADAEGETPISLAEKYKRDLVLEYLRNIKDKKNC